jgi:hypothetical protein
MADHGCLQAPTAARHRSRCNGRLNEENAMTTRIVLAAALLAALAGCATQRNEAYAWNGGTWNSTLGYHGPTNTMAPVGPR